MFCYVIEHNLSSQSSIWGHAFFKSLTITLLLPICIKLIDEVHGPAFQASETMLPAAEKDIPLLSAKALCG